MMNIRFKSVMSIDNPIIKNHLVYGRALLPGLAYVDMLYQIAQANGFNVHGTTLKNLSIYNPLVVKEDQTVELIITFTEQQNYWTTIVEGIEKKSNGTGHQIRKKYIGAELHHDSAIAFKQTIKIEDLKSRAAQIADLEDQVYSRAREYGLVHKNNIKSDGTIYLTDEGSLIHLAVPASYMDDAQDYIYHPTLLDGSAMATTMILKSILSEQPDDFSDHMYLPIFYQSFFAAESLQTQCYARVQASSVNQVKDIIYFNIEYFNKHGRQVGVLNRLTLKQLQFEEQINSENTKTLPPKKISKPTKRDAPILVPKSQNHKSIPNQNLEALVKNTFAKFLKVKPYQVNTRLGFLELGLESAQLFDVLKELENIVNEPLNPTLLFEYNNIEELIEYFGQAELDQKATGQEIDPDKPPAPLVVESKAVTVESEHADTSQFEETDIAIIALSGRYPQAATVQEFWTNLKEGKDCITEIPKDRWDNTLYFDEDKNKPGKTSSKWGGFIEDVDKFDALFFNILPKYAEFMDPQERLFMECVWDLFESIGYTQETLQHVYKGKVGVYVGAMYLQYLLFKSDIATEAASAISSYGSIANRVSFFYNLQGPSVAIDTMCSSSAVAIHTACESLIREECQIAIAGGVNVTIHPKKYVGLSQAQLLGSLPDRRSFGDGDGYVSGEGVGAVLLKPLSRAVQDNDRVLAVIKSTATNHGGRGNAYAVPNGNAQARLIEDNLKKSGINPRTISYVESAANGSAMGDTIEVNALTRAFKKYTKDQQFCAIGSVKSNIGHTEAVSGLSQLTKVILQLQHRQLVPSIKAEPPNPNINWGSTPFCLQQELQEWKRPILTINGEEQEFPRRATISSFGAGGSNAHIIVEEYTPLQEETVAPTPVDSPQIMVFSAQNRKRLLAIVEQMLEFIRQRKRISLSELAYTLQVGREAMEYRLAMVVSNQEEIISGLQAFLDSKKEDNVPESAIPIFTWNLGKEDSEIRNFLSGNLGEAVIQLLLEQGNLEKIAIYWTQGGNIPWNELHKGQKVQKISLPTYPFARKRCWVATNEATNHPSPLDQQSEEEELAFIINADKSPRENIQDYIIEILTKKLYIARDQIELRKNIHDYGIDSIAITKFIRDFEKKFQIKITLREVLESRTFIALATHLAQKIENRSNQASEQAAHDKLAEDHQEPSSHIDDQVTATLEKLVQGELDLTAAQKLLEGEETA